MNGWPRGNNLFPKPKGLTKDSRLPSPWAAINVYQRLRVSKTIPRTIKKITNSSKSDILPILLK